MRFFKLRKADVDSDLRKTFERYGVVTMQVAMGATNYIQHKEQDVTVMEIRAPLLDWLTEQYDRAERKETWSVTMETAITLLVAVEGFFSILNFVSRKG